MDKLKERLNTLRSESDSAQARSLKADSDLRDAELRLTERGKISPTVSYPLTSVDAQILSAKNKCKLLEADLKRAEGRVGAITQEPQVNHESKSEE